MKKLLLAIVMPVMAMPAFAADFSDLAVKAADLKTAAQDPAFSGSLTIPEPVAVGLAARTAGNTALNTRLDRLIRDELFMTLGGVKPITSVTSGFHGITTEDFRAALAAVADGTIRNPDLVFFPDDSSTFPSLALASRSALVRLGHDTAAKAVFAEYSIPFPATPEGWINAYPTTFAGCVNDFFVCNMVNGLAYGYPPLEVEAYSLDDQEHWVKVIAAFETDATLLAEMKEAGVPVPASPEGWMEIANQASIAAAIVGKPLPWQRRMCDLRTQYPASPRQSVSLEADNFSTPAYTRFTNKELERDAYFLRATYILTRNYERLISEGVSPLEIMNDPARLKEGMPEFPPGLLAR